MPKIRPIRIMTALLGTSAALLAFAATAQKQPATPTPAQLAQFESKVRPLFLTSCVSCHGKDTAQGGLRLDIAVPIEKAQEVIKRVKGEGGKSRMPIGGELSKDKIAALEEWVSGGAPWPTGKISTGPDLFEKGKTHWSFQPLRLPAIPRVRNRAWVRNPIDAFVLHGLETKGLKPSPVASRRDLIRRLTYDLIGLPPTPEEVAAFESDKSPDAYERLVDRLLASPHYGEKWARHWLDLVRFAETNSYERDNPKPYIYKYRDYVIRSFNLDKPYDRFVKEQLAGDEMDESVGDAVVGTAYYRLGIWDDEPADKLQAEYDDFDDIIATTGQAFLGLTLDCARCHDHKLDPIPQKDYYRLLACFRNINRFKNGGMTDESRYFPDSESMKKYESKLAEIASKRKENLTQIAEIENKIQTKCAQFINANDVADLSYKYYERDWKRIPDFENEPVIASGTMKPPFVSTKPRERNEEFAFDYDGHLNVPKEGDYTFRMYAEGGYRLTVSGEKLFESFASEDKPVEKTKKKHLAAGKVGFSIIFNQRHSQHGLTLSWSGPDFAERPLSALDSCVAGGLSKLFAPEVLKQIDKPITDRLTALIDQQAGLEKQAPPTDKVLCVSEQGSMVPETHILLRGVPTAVGDKVEPGFPMCAGGGSTIVPSTPSSRKSTGLRTTLANWIASSRNPLTARVIVNRIWQHHFGRGIVRTPNDFGLQGAKPTHPELLDWLAATFASDDGRRMMDDNKGESSIVNRQSSSGMGWSFKKLHKLILMSNTYKQSSRPNQPSLAADPQNDSFWRFDMRRLTAEEIRDSMLAVGGNLNLAMYGPSVYPEIPKEILAAQSRPGKDWFTERMTAQDVCRRSIYVSIKRSLIYPLFASFDLPETDRPSGIRFASTQPTQALGMMNGPLANKQASIMAERVRKEVGNDPRALAKRVFAVATQRTPTEADISEGVRLMERLQLRGSKREQAQTYLCLMALNLDEFFYVD